MRLVLREKRTVLRVVQEKSTAEITPAGNLTIHIKDLEFALSPLGFFFEQASFNDAVKHQPPEWHEQQRRQ